MKLFWAFFSFLLLFSASAPCVLASDNDVVIAVVVSRDSNIEKITKRELIDVFMGRFDVLETGQKVQAVDYSNGFKLRADFYMSLVGKEERQINAYWSRLIFSGRAKPPVQVSSIVESTRYVADNRTALAYMPANSVSEEMKIVLVLE